MASVELKQQTGPSSQLFGVLAALSTIVIWATWLIATRYSSKTALGPIDLSIIRYAVPAAVLAPVWLKTGLWPRNTPKIPLVLMICGSGAPFFQIAAYGMHYTPASAAGVLLPGFMPLATALIGIAVFGERPDLTRKLGFAAIFLGGLILLVRSLAEGSLSWQSYIVLPFGATCWAIYTHAFKQSGLTAAQGGALICIWSTILNFGLAAIFGTHLFEASMQELAPQLISQGLLSGLAATLAYGFAIRILGGTQAAAFTALTPVAAAVGGAMVLDETLGLAGIIAAGVTGAGVALSTGILSRRK